MITRYFKSQMTSIIKFLRQYTDEKNAIEWVLKANAYAQGHCNHTIPAIVAMLRTYDMPSNTELIKQNAAREGYERFSNEPFYRPEPIEIEQTLKELKRFIESRHTDFVPHRIIITQ